MTAGMENLMQFNKLLLKLEKSNRQIPNKIGLGIKGANQANQTDKLVYTVPVMPAQVVTSQVLSLMGTKPVVKTS